jgi:hypothetical protein
MVEGEEKIGEEEEEETSFIEFILPVVGYLYFFQEETYDFI